jgi:hypothetical protein
MKTLNEMDPGACPRVSHNQDRLYGDDTTMTSSNRFA